MGNAVLGAAMEGLDSEGSWKDRKAMHSRKLMVLTGVAVSLGLGSSAARAEKIYWAPLGGGPIMRANLDGTGVETVLSTTEQVDDIAIDSDGGKIYWLHRGSARIVRANLDGSVIEELLFPDVAQAIALNPTGNEVYWAEPLAIRRANLDGSGVGDVVALDQSLNRKGIAYNKGDGRISWTDASTPHRIRRVFLDGTGLEQLVSPASTPSDIVVDPQGAKMYWTENGAGLLRANLDGSGVETIVEDFFTDIGTKIALDLPGGKIYWVGGFGHDTIKRANLDGSGVEDAFTGMPFATAMTIAPVLSPPADIPTVSEWGLVAMSLLMLTAGTVVFMRRRMDNAGCVLEDARQVIDHQ